MNVKTMEIFCKDASQNFFNEFGLISHLINSFDSPFDRLPPLDMNMKAGNSSAKMHHEPSSMSLG